MKVRIDQYSIRFRLSENEWATLLADERLSQSTHVPGNEGASLTYTLELDPQVADTQIALHGSNLTVKLAPKDWVQTPGTNRESIKRALPACNAENEPLTLIVEKDIIISRKRTERSAVNIINESEKQAI